MSQKTELLEALEKIVPGKTYPASVKVTETVGGKPLKLVFLLQSYYVGMYCAIHVNDARMPHQTGDHNNTKLVRGLKRDLLRAAERGAEIKVGPLRNCILTP